MSAPHETSFINWLLGLFTIIVTALFGWVWRTDGRVKVLEKQVEQFEHSEVATRLARVETKLDMLIAQQVKQ